jgi:hypothetical protein
VVGVVGAIATKNITQNIGTGGTIFLVEWLGFPCLTTHRSGWPQHSSQRLILRATAKFDNVIRSRRSRVTETG